MAEPSSFDYKNLFKLFEDPVNLALMKEVVTLVPCMHKMERIMAENFYGVVQNGACSIPNGKCLICKQVVQVYYVDHTFQDVINRIFSFNKPEQILNELPEKSKAVVQAEIEDLPFPGKPAKFEHLNGNWDYFNHGGGSWLRQALRFKSITPDSFFTEFSLLGYKDGSVCLAVYYGEKRGRNDYFKHYNLESSDTCVRTDTVSELRTLFTIIAKNNEIPAAYFPKIREIVEQGRC